MRGELFNKNPAPSASKKGLDIIQAFGSRFVPNSSHILKGMTMYL
jgi:hypothetical protein